MASEIIVNTIKAPTSGANANKIIVGSGQELDASAGLITPAGHVIQTIVAQNGTRIAVSPSAYNNVWPDQSITMKGNNKLLVTAHFSGVGFANHDSRGSFKYFQDNVAGTELARDFGYTITDVRSPYSVAHISGTLTAGQTYSINIRFAAVNGTVAVNDPFNAAGQSTLIIQEIAQ